MNALLYEAKNLDVSFKSAEHFLVFFSNSQFVSSENLFVFQVRCSLHCSECGIGKHDPYW